MVRRGVATAEAIDTQVRELVAAKRGDAAAAELLRALGPEVLGYLSAMLRSDADADDVFAAASLRIWRNLPSFEWKCSLRTWVYLIAHREMVRFRQGGRPHAEGRVPLSEVQSVLSAARSTIGPTERGERRSRLQQLREELPDEDQALLVLRVDRGLEWEEVALMFRDDSEALGEDELKREAARLRKRFQLVKARLIKRAQAEGLEPPH